jgi:hypothetical protein
MQLGMVVVRPLQASAAAVVNSDGILICACGSAHSLANNQQATVAFIQPIQFARAGFSNASDVILFG